MRILKWTKIPLLLFLAIWTVQPVWAEIKLSNDHPSRGDRIQISLDTPEDTLTITYRPNSSVERYDTLYARPASTQFSWRPGYPGVVQIAASGETRNVSVRFEGVSWKGILVMILAGAILLGGATFSMIMLFRDKDDGKSLDIEHRPDT